MPKKKYTRASDLYEMDQIDESYRNLAGKKKNKKNPNAKKKMITTIIILSCVLVLCLGTLAGLYFFSDILDPERIPENVVVAGVDLSGLQREEALPIVTEAVQKYYADKNMVVTIGEHTVMIPASVIDAKVDVEAMLDAAFALNETEDPAANTNISLASYLTINEYGITEALKEFENLYPTEVVEHKWEIVDETEVPEDESVAPEKKQKLVITMGKFAYALDTNAISDEVIALIFKGEFGYSAPIEIVEPQPLDIDAIYTQHCTQAVDAVMDQETFEVSDHVYGFAFDLDAAKAALELATYEDVLEFPFEVLHPTVTKESLSGLLFRDVLASYTAKSASSTNRNTNLRLSCEAVNGLILYPGDIFNYNKTLGQRTEAKGYKPAASYVGGETVDTVGGGICQTSSSIYYCALLADLEIVQRHNHAYISSYMPYGMDATVDWSGPNFRFKNNTNYPIKIEATAKGGNVTIRLLGTDEKSYYVKMTYEVVSKTPWETKYVEVKVSENTEGYKDGQVLTSAYTGYEIKTYKNKYDKETNELISKTLQTHDRYAKRDKRVVKLIDDTLPPPTEPSVTPDPTPDPAPDPAPDPTPDPGSGGEGAQ